MKLTRNIDRIRKNGFTLIELISVLALTSLVIMLTLTFFRFGNYVFIRGNEQYDIQSDVRIASDYIQNQVRYATSLQLVTSSPTEDDNIKRGDLDTNDIARETFGLEYIVIEDDKLVHYIIDDTVDSDGNLLDSDEFHVKYESPYTLPGTSFSSSSNNELIFVVNASDRPGNYALRSLIVLPNYSLYDGMVVEKFGDDEKEIIGVRFTRDAGMMAGLSGGIEIIEPSLTVTEIVAVGNNSNQKRKEVRLTFSNTISTVNISSPLESVIENLVAVEIRHNTNNDLPNTFQFEVTDIEGNTLTITIVRNDIDYSYTIN